MESVHLLIRLVSNGRHLKPAESLRSLDKASNSQQLDTNRHLRYGSSHTVTQRER